MRFKWDSHCEAMVSKIAKAHSANFFVMTETLLLCTRSYCIASASRLAGFPLPLPKNIYRKFIKFNAHIDTLLHLLFGYIPTSYGGRQLPFKSHISHPTISNPNISNFKISDLNISNFKISNLNISNFVATAGCFSIRNWIR